MEKGIGDLALEIMGGMSGNSITENVDNTELPTITDAQREVLMGKSHKPKVVTESVKEEKNEETSTSPNELIEVLESLQISINKLMEMTTVGAIGVNMPGAKSEDKPSKSKVKKLKKKKEEKKEKILKEDVSDFIKRVNKYAN